MADWIETHRAVIHQWTCDHLGHMNVRYYAHIFDDAGFHFWTGIPQAQAIMKAHNIGVVVARTTTDFLKEARAGELVYLAGGVASFLFHPRFFDVSGPLELPEVVVQGAPAEIDIRGEEPVFDFLPQLVTVTRFFGE